MKILGVLIMSIVCLKAAADGHEKPDAGAEAMAMETAVCSFRDGKTYADFQKVVDKFKKWAADSNYSTYFVSNTPLYASPQAMPDVVLMEFSSFEGIATAWKKIWEDEPQFLEIFEKTMSCSRSLMHYYPMHTNVELEPDDYRIMGVNWCTRKPGVTWDQLSKQHQEFSFGPDVIYWGAAGPSLGIREGDMPGEFAHLAVFSDIEGLMRYENQVANENGWRRREAYYQNFAECTGTNVYQQEVLLRPTDQGE